MGRKRTGEAMLVGVGGVSVTSAEREMARKGESTQERMKEKSVRRPQSQADHRSGRGLRCGHTHLSYVTKKDVFSRFSPPTKEASEPPSHPYQTPAGRP